MSATDVIIYYSPWTDGTINYYSTRLKNISETEGINDEFKKFVDLYKIYIELLHDCVIGDYYMQADEHIDIVIEKQLGLFGNFMQDYQKGLNAIMKNRQKHELYFDKYPTVSGLIDEYVAEKLKEHSLAGVINGLMNGI